MASYISRTSTSTTIASDDSHSIWDPRATLQISSDCCCVGYANSKKGKCLNAIAGHNLSKADTLLYDLSTQQPDAEALQPKLRRLAEYLLCKRWHQPQARDMVDKWSDRMEAAYMYGVVETTLRERSRPSTPSRSSTSTSSAMSGPTHTERETLQETIRAMQEALRSAERRLAAIDYPTPSSSTRSSPAISRVSTSDISSLNLSRTSTIRSSSSSSSSQSDTASSSQPCTRAHVRRRAIDDECPICKEDFLLRDRLVWCKNSCGRTVHKECFEAWRAQCVESSRAVTCTICRAAWGSECGCDD